MGAVNTVRGAVRGASTAAVGGGIAGFLEQSAHPTAFGRPGRPISTQELTMADLAFVVTTIAVFALVALVAKGVTKL
ncbi:hypothetical protein ACFV0R_33820 [Streptomyces sp. NPDC059578]|jgi:hypothetical protein|uniref:hypothetical protein n=1 Tax=unclassified Streptomyces TaxID=2593676 RepID=UPI00365033A0